jgi:Flp pilus assembly protein TadG
MRYRSQHARRRGSILPLVVISLVALLGFTALAIDVGMLVTGRTQAQNAADTAAMTAARSLDGSPSPNYNQAATNGRNAAANNKVLSVGVRTAEVEIQFGTYHYNVDDQVFEVVPTGTSYTPLKYTPLPTGDNYNLARSRVRLQPDRAFSRVFSLSPLNVSAAAVAAHRPRDFTLVLDYSGSMNNESDLWNNEGYLGTANNSPNNTDAVVPTFGHYSSGSATLQCTSTDDRVGKCNVTQEVLEVDPLVDDFYQHARGSTAVHAFSPVGYTTLYAPPTGDQYKAKSGTSTTPPTFAKTVQEVTGATNAQVTAKTDAAMPDYGSTFQGFTEGPGLWGRTFFIWPPDPDYNTTGTPSSGINGRSGYPASLSSPPRDWRRRFFLKTGGSHPSFGGQVDDNSLLWDGSGNWRNPGTSYVINYRAILKWIKDHCVQASAGDGKPFPPQLRAGRILYYDAVPDDVPAAAYNHGTLNHTLTSGDPSNNTLQNQRFWKEYIDYVLGVWRDPFNSVRNPGSPACSYGPDFTWGTAKASAPVSGYAAAPTTRMHPQDNPKRPRHRFWFGPMTMVQFISDCGLNPGTAHDISMFPAKMGIAAALKDIENNHPNDLVSLIMYNRPIFDNDPPGVGNFSQAQFSLSRDYAGMISALWYPPNSGTTDVRPWDANGLQTPRAFSDYTANTCTIHGLMLAYNQFSGNSDLRTSLVGGRGRKGAQRIVILETDGMANVSSVPTEGFHDDGPYNSYYRILPDDTVNSGSYSSSALLQVVMAICNKDDGTPVAAIPADTPPGSTYPTNPGYPGFGTPRKPVLIHTLGFGPIFEPTASGSEPANVLMLMQQISTIGGTVFPSSAADPDYGYKWCIGDMEERKQKLKTAFLKIMNEAVTVTLIE